MKINAWFGAAAVLILVSSCSADREPALRVGAAVRPSYEPMHLAQRMSRYDSRKIRLIDFSSSVEVMRAYRNGVVDIAALTADEALSVAATEPGKHRIILIAGFSNGVDAIVAQPAFTSFDRLKGHRIGVEPNVLGGYILARALQKNSMKLEDIKAVPISLEQQLLAFESGDVEAIVTFDPNRQALLSSGGREIFSSKDLPGEVIDVILTRASLLAERRSALLHFMSGWFFGVEYFQKSPDDAARLAAEHERTAAESFAASLPGIQLVDRERNRILLDQGADGIETILHALSERMRAAGLLTVSIDPKTVYSRLLLE